MESLHRYLVARFHIADYDEYLQLVALFRNTAAIEAAKARVRYKSLGELFDRTMALYVATTQRIRERALENK